MKCKGSFQIMELDESQLSILGETRSNFNCESLWRLGLQIQSTAEAYKRRAKERTRHNNGEHKA